MLARGYARAALVAFFQFFTTARGATLAGSQWSVAWGADGGAGAGHGAHGGARGVADFTAGASSAQGAAAYLSLRSREHQENMNKIMANMTVASALATLRAHGRDVSPEIVAMVEERANSRNLRALSKQDPENEKGYASLLKAKTMLNNMIEEVMEKYDAELDRCCDFEKAQSVLIEESRQDISFFGGEAAEAREWILDAQQQIEECETKLPKTKAELSQHEEKCEKDIAALKDELDIVLSDIAVMSMILKMTECETSPLPKSFLLLSCEDECGTYLTFRDEDLHNKTSGLQSQAAQQLLQEELSQSYADETSVEFTDADEQTPNVTTPMPMEEPQPPVRIPRTKPCKTPRVMDKLSAKCSIKNSPNCKPLQERFLLIQAGIMDRRDELKEELNGVEKDCKETKDNYEAQISDLESRLKDQQTRLGSATKKLTVSNEQMRLKEAEFHELKATWASETVTCHGNYENFEGEECGLKKIRGELFKMQGGDTSAFFQDCSVSEWEADECSKSCAKGTVVLSRGIITPMKGGTKCPPLAKTKTCNMQKCPIDCSLADWEGWSSCSADCGGGMKERIRQTLMKPRYLGESCTQTTEAESCNMAACDANCVLSDWTEWSDCSKQCGGGTSFRRTTVVEQATGSGTCPAIHDEAREQSMHCNEHPCLPKLATLRCESELDVVLLLDGSGSVGSYGWAQTKEVGKDLAKAFHAHHADIKVAIVLFSGPSRWRDVERCGGNTPPFGWTKMYTKGAYGASTTEKAAFNDLFSKAHLGIVRRQCMWCWRSHRDIYYRRKTQPASFDAWENLMVTWQSTGFHEDFDIYSTLQDALQDTKAWKFCNGGDKGIGFPRDCSPWGSAAPWQWQSLTRGGQRHFKWEALTKVEVDMEKDCKIKFVQHFTNKTEDLVNKIEAMEWPQGATLTAQALQAAQEELPLSGRSEAPAVVVVITDGRPVSVRKTEMAAHELRKKSRLFWVAVTRYAPTKDLKKWASLPNDENLVAVANFQQLDSKATINAIISDVCPAVS